MASPPTRTRTDRCPGVWRPWPADDGALVRLRLVGGRLPAPALTRLVEVAQAHGDGDVHLTARANVQLRALPSRSDDLAPEVVRALRGTGLVPSRSHELVRNVMVSPFSGLAGSSGLPGASSRGRADLRPVATDLDRLLCADPALAGLPGRFLFVLDDGSGDLLDRETDLGLVALDATTAQLRVGEGWGEVVPLTSAAPTLVSLARHFLRVRGEGPTAAWHVAELPDPLAPPAPADPRLPRPGEPPAYGVGGGVEHVAVPGGVLGPEQALALAARGGELVVTPWHGVVAPLAERSAR